MTNDGKREIHSETFKHQLADNKWHQVALSVSGTEILLLIDCHPFSRRVTHFKPDRNFNASNIELFVGQSFKSNYALKVSRTIYK